MHDIVQQWRVLEMNFKYEGQYNNPFLDVNIVAEFKSPGGKIITRPAYWNGGNVWKVRFAPTETGEWTYIVHGISEDGITGKIECIPYSGELDIYKHGFLKVGPQGKYLVHADNTPFFWLGDTHWGFAVTERWNESNCDKYESQFKAIVDRRVEQHFNVYQCNFQCSFKDEGYLQSFGKYFINSESGLLPNTEWLQNDLDLKMRYLADNGFVVAAGLSWFFAIFEEGAIEKYKLAVRYIIARYGAYPMIWTLAGEVGSYSAATKKASVDSWREIALEIEKYDSYGHLQTAHYTNERPFADYYQDEAWFDFTMNQAGHGDLRIDAKAYREHMAKYPSRPFIESESLYEGVLTLEANGRRRATPIMVRRAAYLAIQNGACGYTYGAQGMWHLQWDEPEENVPDFMGFGSFPAWYRAIEFEGANSMRIMRDFYESVNWSKLRPLDESCCGCKIRFTDEELKLLFQPHASGDEEMKTIVVYFSESNRFPIIFSTLVHPSYTAKWFHPGTGEYSIIDKDIRPENGIWESPVKPDGLDWVLLLTANSFLQ